MFPKIITLFLLIHSHLVCNAQHLRDPSTVTHKDEIIQTERPIIYTFFELKKGLHHEYSSKPHENLLKAWTTLWTEAGWEPRILTLEDAKQHPDYEKYKEAISSVKNLYEGGYDFMCFMRWLAMAARGTGGWMSDNDVFPMGITPTEGLILPNKGRFTGHERHVPSLLSGSAEEWKRMAKDLLDFAAEESKHVDWFSDMNALKMIHEQNPSEYIKMQNILNGFPYEAMGKVDCNLIGQFKAVHLAHMATHRAIDEGHIEYSGKPEDIGHLVERMRPGLARKLYQEWNEQCSINIKAQA